VATDPSQSGILVTPTYVPTKRSLLGRRSKKAARSQAEVDIWLDGEVVACGCPDCGAPMSIRMWLKLADCFRCMTAIELTEELIDEIERLEKKARIRAHSSANGQSAAVSKSGNSTAAKTPGAALGNLRKSGSTTSRKDAEPDSRAVPPPPPPSTPQSRKQPSKVADPKDDPQRRVAAAKQPSRVRKKVHEMATVGAVSVWWHSMLREMTAWMVSAVLHLAALLLLALWGFGNEKQVPRITLSTEVRVDKREGGETFSLQSDDIQFDLHIDPNDIPETHDAKVKLDQDARDLRIEKTQNLPNAASYDDTLAAVKSSDPNRRALAVRDPRVRAEVVRQEGGTTLTEAAVARGLRWMSQHQSSDGSWSLNQFNQAGKCDGRCSGGGMRSDSAGTSLALLPFLGAGQTHLVGKYQKEVAGGLKYLLSIQKPDGDLRGNSQGHSGMYAHGQAALVLCEAYKMTGDQKLKIPAQKAVNFVVNAQLPFGGWRYQPATENKRQQGDTSVLGWQVLVLHSAKSAYLDMPDNAMPSAALYLDSARASATVPESGRQVQYGKRGGLYGYLPKQGFKPSMTAEALLCRMMMGWKISNPGLQEGIGFLVNHHLPDMQKKDLYYWYYATQMMHHVGGEPWDRWNARMREILPRLQETKGHQIGSWPPGTDSSHGGQGGRLYTTAFATAILEVYYRHAPLFRQIELE
jgi:hypothetical protein